MKTDLSSVNETAFDMAGLVYVKRLGDEEINQLVSHEALEQLGTDQDLFAVHSQTGERLAIVVGRDAAFEAALAHDLRPRSVH